LKFVDETATQANKWKPAKVQRRSVSPHAGGASHAPGRSLGALVVAANSLAKSGHQVQAISQFWDAYAACTSGPVIANASTMVSQRWVQAAVQQAHADPALNSALSTLAFSRLSRIHADDSIKQQATLHYNDTVKKIRKALNHPERRTDDTLLAAVMVLGTYEVSPQYHIFPSPYS
jgi:tellurite resistance protein